MITQLTGPLIELTPTFAVLDCHGVGYQVKISLNTFTVLERLKEKPTLFTVLIIRDDAHTLFGFSSKTERTMFQQLLSVNGVGPASTIMMLSSLSVEQIQTAIVSEDNALLQSVKGIGAKTAQRIVIDLKDKIEKNPLVQGEDKGYDFTLEKEAVTALESLGISKKMAEKVIASVLKNNSDISLEELLKAALKKL